MYSVRFSKLHGPVQKLMLMTKTDSPTFVHRPCAFFAEFSPGLYFGLLPWCSVISPASSRGDIR